MRGKIAGIAAVVVLAGCANNAPWPQQVDDWCRGMGCTEEVRAAMLRGEVVVGMTWLEVNKVLGAPIRINRNSYGPDQHVYRKVCQYSRQIYQDNIFVYFNDKDVVVDWQDLGCIN